MHIDAYLTRHDKVFSKQIKFYAVSTKIGIHCGHCPFSNIIMQKVYTDKSASVYVSTMQFLLHHTIVFLLTLARG